MQRKILVMGLPGAGKTTLADVLAPLLNAVVFNADAVRANLSRDLGFSHQDRIEHARRMRNLRLDFGLVIERLDQAIGNLTGADTHIGLYGDIHLRTGGLEVPRQAGKTV